MGKANRLRALRQRAGLKQSELAAQAGVTAPAVSLIESGERCPCEATTVGLARVLGSTPEDVRLAWLSDELDRIRAAGDDEDIPRLKRFLGALLEFNPLPGEIRGPVEDLLTNLGERGLYDDGFLDDEEDGAGTLPMPAVLLSEEERDRTRRAQARARAAEREQQLQTAASDDDKSLPLPQILTAPPDEES